MTNEERLTRLEAIVNILIDENLRLRGKLRAFGNETENDVNNQRMLTMWQCYPDGDFDKTIFTKFYSETDTEYANSHLE